MAIAANVNTKHTNSWLANSARKTERFVSDGYSGGVYISVAYNRHFYSRIYSSEKTKIARGT